MSPDRDTAAPDPAVTMAAEAGWSYGIWHALGATYPDLGSAVTAPTEPTAETAREPEVAGTRLRRTVCGLMAEPALCVPVFDPDRRPEASCQECVWWEAIRTDTVSAALTRLAASPGHGLAAALVEAVLADAAAPSGDGIDHPATVDLLAAISSHAGDALISGDCVEGECDHPDRPQCPVAVVACPACSVVNGGWAGEWEGRYRIEATVATPCSVLTTLAAHYGIDLDDHRAEPAGVVHAGQVLDAAAFPIGYLLTEDAYAALALDQHGVSTQWDGAAPIGGES